MKRKVSAAAMGLLITSSAFGQAYSGAGIDTRGGGSASATGGYRGNGVGFGKTRTDTGRVNFAQGLGVGFDHRGLSLSSSYALGARQGPAVAGTFNLGIGLDGRVNGSVGRSTARGGSSRQVDASGFASPGRYGSAGATAGGTTRGGFGTVRSNVDSWQGRTLPGAGYRSGSFRSLPVRSPASYASPSRPAVTIRVGRR